MRGAANTHSNLWFLAISHDHVVYFPYTWTTLVRSSCTNAEFQLQILRPEEIG